MTHREPRVVITAGDPAGVGPEVVLDVDLVFDCRFLPDETPESVCGLLRDAAERAPTGQIAEWRAATRPRRASRRWKRA